jgi:hypothetical protein
LREWGVGVGVGVGSGSGSGERTRSARTRGDEVERVATVSLREVDTETLAWVFEATAVLGGFKAERASPVLGRFAPEQP